MHIYHHSSMLSWWHTYLDRLERFHCDVTVGDGNCRGNHSKMSKHFSLVNHDGSDAQRHVICKHRVVYGKSPIPYSPCMEYLATFSQEMSQMIPNVYR